MDTLSPGTLTQLSKCQAKGHIPNTQCADIYLIKENFTLEFPVLRFQKDYLLRSISSCTLPKIRKASLPSQMGHLAPSNTFFITNLLFYPFAEFEQVMAFRVPAGCYISLRYTSWLACLIYVIRSLGFVIFKMFPGISKQWFKKKILKRNLF